MVLDPSPARTPEYVAYEAELKKRTEKFESTFAKRREEAADHFRNKSGMYLPAVLEVEKLPTEAVRHDAGAGRLQPRHRAAVAGVPVPLVEATVRPDLRAVARAGGAARRRVLLPRPEIIQKLTADDAPNRLNPHVAAALKASPPASMLDLAKLYGKAPGRRRPSLASARQFAGCEGPAGRRPGGAPTGALRAGFALQPAAGLGRGAGAVLRRAAARRAVQAAGGGRSLEHLRPRRRTTR